MDKRAKTAAALAVLILAVLLGMFLLPRLGKAGFPDKRLDQAIRGALGRSLNDARAIHPAQLRRLHLFRHQFGYDRKPAPDLRGLERCRNLQTLDLSSSGLEDIAVLGKLKKLRTLILYSNRIADIGPLGRLGRLRELDLDRNRIEDLAPLKTLRDLRDLRLSENRIADLGALGEMSELRRLVLWKNQATDLAPLRDLKQLGELRLDFNQIADLSPLSGLTSLVCLTASSNQIGDLQPLSGLTNLKVLHLDGNAIEDVRALAGLTGIGTAHGNDAGSKVTPETREGVPIYLGLANNKIRDIAPLVQNAGFAKGTGIDLRGNPLNDEAYNKHIPGLRALGVEILCDPRA